jgi:hypothetical protein
MTSVQQAGEPTGAGPPPELWWNVRKGSSSCYSRQGKEGDALLGKGGAPVRKQMLLSSRDETVESVTPPVREMAARAAGGLHVTRHKEPEGT